MAQRVPGGRSHRILTAVVHLPPLAELYFYRMAHQFRAALQADTAKGIVSQFRRVPGGLQPCFPLVGPQWRVYAGGVLASTRTYPGTHKLVLQDMPELRPRALIPFVDGDVARRALVLDMDPNWRRRTAWIYMAEDGTWVLRMRWQRRPLRETHAPTKGSGKLKPRERAYGVRRWSVAPAEWPRSPRGRPVSTPTAIRRLGRDTVEKLLASDA